MFFAACGLASLLGAIAAPFLLYSLVVKASRQQPAVAECIALSVFGLVFCLWLLSVFTALPAR